MAVFFNNAITDEGEKLLAKLQIGAVFVPTKMVMGSGYMPDGATTESMAAVVTPEQEITITEKELLPDTSSVVLGGGFSNKNVETDFYFRELGLYAKAVNEDGAETEEILYAYGNAGENPDLIPAYSTETLIEMIMRLIVYVGNDTTVRLELNSSAFVLQDSYEKQMVAFTEQIKGKADAEHDHNYAGSASAGGSANSAVKLDASAGSTTQPVYFSGGKPVATSYALNKTVPANAAFTDTTYGAATTSTAGLMTAAMVTKLNGIAAGAQVNAVTGVKGNNEPSYRTGAVNLTPANIGASPSGHTHNYLPLSGGDMQGSIGIGSSAPILMYGNSFIGHTSYDGLMFSHVDGHQYKSVIAPKNNGGSAIGATARRIYGVYSVVAANVSSDMRLKEERNTDMDKYVALLDLLEPEHYVRTDDIAEVRTRHTGYIAQKVWKAMKDVGLKETDWYGFQKEMKEDGSVYTYGLAYEEFIPILHAKIRQLEERINAQDEIIGELKERVAASERENTG